MVRTLLASHSKVCSRHKQKRKTSSVADFVALEFPALADNETQASEQADRIEKQLRLKGFNITRGYHLEYQVGYPVMDSEGKQCSSSTSIISHDDVSDTVTTATTRTTTSSDQIGNEDSGWGKLETSAWSPLSGSESPKNHCDDKNTGTPLCWIPSHPISNFFTHSSYSGTMNGMFDLSLYSTDSTSKATHFQTESASSSLSTSGSEKDTTTMVCC